MANRRRGLNEAERAERRERDRRRLEEATRALLRSEGWQRWIAVRRQNGLRRYSPHNQALLAYEACAREIELRYVAGYRWWQEHGYQVRVGERALRVLAPIRRKERDDERDEDLRVVGFRAVPVFDRSQVEAGPEAVPLAMPACEPISGDSHAHLLPRLERFAGEIGCRVSYEEELAANVGGFYRHSDRLIALDAGPANARVRTLLHELGHALVAREDLSLTYAEEECVVESVGHVVAAGAGLDTSGEAVAYCASWGERDDLEAVERATELIDGLAKRLEEVIESGS